MEAGDYYVTFQDGLSNQHLSFGELLELDGATVFNLDLKDEGSIRGDVRSDADNDLIKDRSVRIQFLSENGVVFVEDTIADEEFGGLFGTSDEYGGIDLPYGMYDVIVEQEGYEKFEGTVEIDGQNDYYNEINLIPKMVNITLEMTYLNATGSTVPLTGVTVAFTATTGENFTHVTDEEGRIIISNMIPKTYEIEIDETQNEGADQFKLPKQNVYVKAGKGDQLFKRGDDDGLTWKVSVSGTIFYDRDFDGEADSNELLANSKLEIWTFDGTKLESTIVAETDGSYQTYLKTGAYKTWAYTTEGTSYVELGTLELDEATSLDRSLARGVNYNVRYQSLESSEPIDLGQVRIEGMNFSFDIGLVDSGISIWVPAGEYDFSGEYMDLAGSDDYIYVLDKSIDIADSMDGMDQTESIEKKLMRGIEVSLDKTEYEIPIGQAAKFTFNVTGTGHLDTLFLPTVDNIPQNWTVSFEPTKISAYDGMEMEVVLSITPDDGVVPKVWEVFHANISWSDDSDNEVDDILHTFTITVTPIEQPDPDFVVSELTWSPETKDISPGTEVTLSVTISNLVNHSGSHDVPVAFYADGEMINLTTAFFDGSGDDVTVNATWTASSGSHTLKVGIDPDDEIDESDTENNDRFMSISVEAQPEEEENSILRMAALVVVALVAGLAYVSYRSRR